MPRSNSSRRQSKWQRAAQQPPRDPELALGGMRRARSETDGEWIVQRVRPRADEQSYTCPGCRQQVSARAAHIVAWREDGPLGASGLESRRHWHEACFASRQRRR